MGPPPYQSLFFSSLSPDPRQSGREEPWPPSPRSPHRAQGCEPQRRLLCPYHPTKRSTHPPSVAHWNTRALIAPSPSSPLEDAIWTNPLFTAPSLPPRQQASFSSSPQGTTVPPQGTASSLLSRDPSSLLRTIPACSAWERCEIPHTPSPAVPTASAATSSNDCSPSSSHSDSTFPWWTREERKRLLPEPVSPRWWRRRWFRCCIRSSEQRRVAFAAG